MADSPATCGGGRRPDSGKLARFGLPWPSLQAWVLEEVQRGVAVLMACSEESGVGRRGDNSCRPSSVVRVRLGF